MTITRLEAYNIAKKLSAEGKSHSQIGPLLAAQGYKSARSGEALTQGGVQALLAYSTGPQKAKPKKRKKKVAAVGPSSLSPKQARGKLDAVSRLLGLTDVPAEDRIAMVQLLLGN